MLDDDLSTAANNTRCQGNCSAHDLIISSEAAQTIYVSMHTWDYATADYSCFFDSGLNYWQSDELGSGYMMFGSRMIGSKAV